jgi:hypothetical protein
MSRKLALQLLADPASRTCDVEIKCNGIETAIYVNESPESYTSRFLNMLTFVYSPEVPRTTISSDLSS